MPFSSLPSSPLVPGISPVSIYYREQGEGVPLVFLHGGWGYEIYPFNRQIDALRERHRIIIPDRSGYGRSTHLVEDLPANFHYLAATETLSLLDSLQIERAVLWGHSDGAVIAAILGFTAPDRVSSLVLEAFHYYRLKPSSRHFFETLAYRPEGLGEELVERFAREHGADYWRRLITTHARAWLQIGADDAANEPNRLDDAAAPHDVAGPFAVAAAASDAAIPNDAAGPIDVSGPSGDPSVAATQPDIAAADDLYAARLHEITAPTLIIHGRLDPRTEPGELDAIRHELPNAEMQILNEGTHSPHSESATADLVTHVAGEFLNNIHR